MKNVIKFHQIYEWSAANNNQIDPEMRNKRQEESLSAI
jgi:hypothetical protein